MKPSFTAVAVLLLAIGCDHGTMTSPDAPTSLAEWSPYLGMHQFGPMETTQGPYVEPLLANGSVRGLRLEYYGPQTGAAASWALSHGAEDILGILPNDMLTPDPCAALDRAVASAPGIRYWEIGNEVQLFVPMPASEYVPIYAAVAACAAQRHPDIVVMPGAPVGNNGGQDFLRGALDNGLLQSPVPILALHYYSTGNQFLPDIKRQLQRFPASTEVWVTEAGFNGTAGHLSFVRDEYPRLRSAWRATRIYWYVFAECSQYSLVMGLPDTCAADVTTSPLYDLLKGGRP